MSHGAEGGRAPGRRRASAWPVSGKQSGRSGQSALGKGDGDGEAGGG